MTKDNLLRITALSFAAVRLVNYFINNTILNYIGTVLLVFLIIQAFFKLNKTTKIVVAALLGIGAAILFANHATLAQWIIALNKNSNLAMLFIFVGMMSMPFFYEDYQSELKTVVQTKMSDILGFYILTFLCTSILGVLISVSSMAIMYELFEPYAKLYDNEDDYLRALTHGYNTSGFWSPAWASTIILTSTLGFPWAKIIPFGIVGTFIMLAIDVVLTKIRQAKHPEKYKKLVPDKGAKVDSKKLGTMVILAVVLIGSILVLSVVTDWDLMIIVPIVAILFPILCALVQGHLPEYKAGIKKYYNKSVAKAQSQVSIFVAAGLLGKAMDIAGIGAKLSTILPDFLIQYQPLMIGAIMLLLILPSLIGVHPSATGTAFVLAVAPATVGMADLTYVLTILVGWLLAIMISPFSANNLMLAGFTGRSNFNVSLKLNGKYVIGLLVLFSILIAIVGPIFA